MKEQGELTQNLNLLSPCAEPITITHQHHRGDRAIAFHDGRRVWRDRDGRRLVARRGGVSLCRGGKEMKSARGEGSFGKHIPQKTFPKNIFCRTLRTLPSWGCAIASCHWVMIAWRAVAARQHAHPPTRPNFVDAARASRPDDARGGVPVEHIV